MNGRSSRDRSVTELAGLTRDAERVRGRLAEVTGAAVSDEGLVEVSVDARGRLVDLRIDPRVFRSPDANWLAATILDCAADAADRVDEQVVAIMTAYLPPDVDVRALLRAGEGAPDVR